MRNIEKCFSRTTGTTQVNTKEMIDQQFYRIVARKSVIKS